MITIDRRQFRNRVKGCWLGKNIGGTLGAPWECKKHTNAFEYYEPFPEEVAPNDDLDLQLVWLKMLEDCGTDPSIRQFAEYWAKYAAAYPWNEYGFWMRNYSRGLLPPVAGCFENYFVDEMGSPIRSEIWACLHPADPQAAARMAWKDSALDHAGGEGTYGEMFWAAVESAAFVEFDPLTLIQIGLEMIPLASHVGRSIREAVWCRQNGLTWGEARERIVTRFGHLQSCNAVPNHGFTIIGWLYGRGFGDCLCKAVNCGYDTDCTGATLGSVMGIIAGADGIPQNWIEPIGSEIILHKFTGDCEAPEGLHELTNRVVALAEDAAATKSDICFGDQTDCPSTLLSRLFRNDAAVAALQQDNHAAVEQLDDIEVWLHYGGEPVLRPGVTRKLRISTPARKLPAKLHVPDGWSCEPCGDNQFLVQADAPISNRNTLRVEIEGRSVDFTILGPAEAQGYPAGKNVEECPDCGARREACICP